MDAKGMRAPIFAMKSTHSSVAHPQYDISCPNGIDIKLISVPVKPSSIASGNAGATRRFVIGEIRDSRPKRRIMSGVAVI